VSFNIYVCVIFLDNDSVLSLLKMLQYEICLEMLSLVNVYLISYPDNMRVSQ